MSRFEGSGYGRFSRVPCDQRDDKVKMGPDTDYDGDGTFAVERITTDESICCVQHGVMVALQTPRLQGHCYHCYNRVTDPGDLRPRGLHASTVESRELTECGGCGVVKFCSAVSYDSQCCARLRCVLELTLVSGLREERLSAVPPARMSSIPSFRTTSFADASASCPALLAPEESREIVR